ncbi:flocculation protein FLO11-like [Xiphophorus maculatus]|uniref:flocculation protein FLO11-like n=1 Tax=Xiphophorus maculatus TaxID=8083 RepID=UPI000C6EF4A7|nr:flocculation protein FLO11-like [Xiphophorus maculatus]
MLPPVLLLLLLLISGAQASFYGVVFNYAFGNLQPSGYAVPYDFKLSFKSCEEFNTQTCNGYCSGPTYSIDEIGGEWCQKGYADTFYYPYLDMLVQSVSTSAWTENRNGIVSSKAVLQFDLRNRSDINEPNSSPRTTILPLVRVPSNCQRNINLLVSDPDGDDIRCRYAAGSECDICTPPSVLSLSSPCSLSFSPTNSSDEGPYAVQMVVEDFPRQNVTLTNSFGIQVMKTASDAISTMPVQFVFKVDPAAPSCTEGEYLPRFLPPTPQNGDQINTNVNQTVEIIIRAEATQADTTELLFSGPSGLTKSSSGSGNFTLTWTPSASEAGLNHHLCFVVQANSSGSVYQSDLRCVIVAAGNSPVTASPPTTTTPPQPTTTPPQPTTTPPQPSTTPPQPTTTPPQPSTALPQPTTTPPQPTTAPPQPSTTPPQPTTAPPQPSTALPQPSTTPPQPSTALPQPTTTPPQPTTAPPQPSTTPPQPTTAPPQPSTALPQPSTALPQPSTALPQPSTALPQPSTAPPQPTTTGPPSSSNPNSTPASESYYVLALSAKLSTSLSLKNESAIILNLIKEEMQSQGLPAGIIVKLLGIGGVQIAP